MAVAQKSGGILRGQLVDNPPSGSLHEESSTSVIVPFMPVYNGLVVYDQIERRNSLDTIRPDLATAWRWNEDKTKLTFSLREGVKWHDGKPFTAADVKCTWDLVAGLDGKKLRKSPREAWYNNLESVTADGPLEATFHLKRPQPAFIALLASGWSAVYPCHVDAATMRTKPIGTGPFKVVDFRPNEGLTLRKNPDYWKEGQPYLDGIDWKILPSRSTRMLAFIAGEFEITGPTDVSVPLLNDIRSQAPHAQCQLRHNNVSTNLIINRDAAPFDNPDLRRALALTLDRQAFIDIISGGEATIGTALLPPPDGVWGMPEEMMKTVVGYSDDVEQRREEARELMRKHGYGPENRLNIKVSTRNISQFRDPAVILIDQLKEIYIDGDLEVVETSIYFNKVYNKQYIIGLNLTGSSVDDPDQHFYENYACGSLRNYTGYCNKDMEALFDQQSMEPDFEKRRKLVWEIDRLLQEDVARPIIMHNRVAGCWQPYVKDYGLMVNSSYNGYRFDQVWLDQ